MANEHPQNPAPDHSGVQPGSGIALAREHELGPAENQTIGKAATWAKALAILLFASGALQLLDGFNVLGAAVNVIIGYFFWQSGKSLRLVVDSEGSDISHLMNAFDQLRRAFLTRIIVMVVAAVVVSLSLIVLLAAS